MTKVIFHNCCSPCISDKFEFSKLGGVRQALVLDVVLDGEVRMADNIYFHQKNQDELAVRDKSSGC